MQQSNTLSLRHELLRKRTLFSFALSLLLIYLFFSRTTLGNIARHVKDVDPFFFFLAFVSHYISYLVRGYRWKKMIEETEFSGRSFDLAKMIFLFQSINCVLPAKLGDLYGAHLMKINFSLRRSFSLGSIFLWRIMDMVIAMIIVVASTFALFGNKIPPEIVSALKVAGLCLLALLALLGVFFPSHKHFPVKWKSERIRGLIDSFQQGLRFKRKLIPLLLVSTTAIWVLEAGRFFFVCRSMAVDISLISVLFISTCSALLTAFPFTPSGLGAVELGMVGLLAFVGIQGPVAYPLIMGDRLIAHWSQLLLGILFVLFNKAIRLKAWQSQEDGASSLIR